MAGETISMIKLKQIFLLRLQGTPYETISRSLGCSRNTVKKYVRLAEQRGLDPAALTRLEDHELEKLFSEPAVVSQYRYQDLESLFPHMEKELKRVGVTRWVLWGEYKARFPDGYAYSQFCDYFRQWEDRSSATAHFDHIPGDKVFIDFTGKKLGIVDPSTGEIQELEVLVAVLGYSGLTYVEAVPSQRKEVFIKTIENALWYFRGVPKALVPDNLKSAVTRVDKYEPEINETLLDFANHYGTTVYPARSRKPRDKALVENMVNIVYSRIFAPLRNRSFFHIRELNAAILELLEAHNNQPFQKEPVSRRQKYDLEEAAQLGTLPFERYLVKHYKTAKVMKNCHVQLEKQYYSVPYRYIGKEVKLIHTLQDVHIFLNQDRIAYHLKGLKPFGYTTQADHLPSSHRFVSEWSPEKFIVWAERISPEVKQYIAAILDQKSYPEQTYRSCLGILSMEKKVGRERLSKAVARATYYRIFHYKAIKKILEGGLDRLLDSDSEMVQTTLPLHQNIRGKDSFQ
jgi:transposase